MQRRDERIERLVREAVDIVPYDPHWPELFRREKSHLRATLPAGLVGRVVVIERRPRGHALRLNPRARVDR